MYAESICAVRCGSKQGGGNAGMVVVEAVPIGTRRYKRKGYARLRRLFDEGDLRRGLACLASGTVMSPLAP